MSKLYLEIDDSLYSLTRIATPDAWVLVHLQGKSQGACYTVRISSGTCDCPDAQYRPKEGGCKHVRALIAVGLLVGVAGTPVLVRREGIASQCGDG